MATQKVIIQFDNFEKRDAWDTQNQHVSGLRIYKRDPWLAAELPDDQVQQLRQAPDLKVHTDVKLSPMSPASSPS
jgi:hypothetical protein